MLLGEQKLSLQLNCTLQFCLCHMPIPIFKCTIFLFLNALFFSVKCFTGLLDLIMICYWPELGLKLEGL